MTIKRVLVIRNDKLGDFMLAWPAIKMLKQALPTAHIVALVPEYTRDMAMLCDAIDEVIIDQRRKNALDDVQQLAHSIRAANIDASISYFSEMRSALALWLARVPLRVGPATKLAQIFLNRRLAQRRSRSLKAEHEYNCDLSRYLLDVTGITSASACNPPYLVLNAARVQQLREDYCKAHQLSEQTRLIIVHPGSGGSAINLSLQQYAELVTHLAALLQAAQQQAYFIITAGPGESAAAQSLSAQLADVNHAVYVSQQGIAAFAEFIAMADLFISGSTGPLHIAGTLDVRTAAFYPSHQSATALRWQTVNSTPRRRAFSTHTNDMTGFEIDKLSLEIVQLLNYANHPTTSSSTSL